MPGLDAVFRSIAPTIMNAFTDAGGVVKEITYVSVDENPSYDSATDSFNTASDIQFTTRGILIRQSDNTDDNASPESITTRLLVAGTELNDIEPKESDYIMIDSVRYEITDFKTAPATALYTFYIRIP